MIGSFCLFRATKKASRINPRGFKYFTLICHPIEYVRKVVLFFRLMKLIGDQFQSRLRIEQK